MIPDINQQFVQFRLIETRHPYESQLWVGNRLPNAPGDGLLPAFSRHL